MIIIVTFARIRLDKCLSAVYQFYVTAVDTFSLFPALHKQYNCLKALDNERGP